MWGKTVFVEGVSLWGEIENIMICRLRCGGVNLV